jgi:hypothetical protein
VEIRKAQYAKSIETRGEQSRKSIAQPARFKTPEESRWLGFG